MYKIRYSIIIIFVVSFAFLALAYPLTPNDPRFDPWDENNPQGNNWGQEFIKLPSAWSMETGSKNIKVSVIDDGFDINHEDLKENIGVVGFETLTKSHGSHVAGIIGGKGNNEKGIAGVMWDSDLYLYGVNRYRPDRGEYFDSMAAILAMKHSIFKGIRIINYSAGTTFKTLEKAEERKNEWKKLLFSWIEEKNKDAFFVFAAGNDKKDAKFLSPANLSKEYNNIVAVGAINEDGDLASFSNFGDSVSVVGPGVDILSTVPVGSLRDLLPCFETIPSIDGYGCISGTSQAAPFVSGLAGLIYSKAEEMGKDLTAAEVKDLIVRGAVNGGKYVSGPDEHQIPIINAYESLKLLVIPPPEEWSLPETIYSSPETIHYRAVTSDNSGNLYMVWIKSVLKSTWYTEVYYTKRDETGWSEPVVIASVPGSAGGQPDILVDNLNRIHVATRGRRGITTDVFYVMWDGTEWSEPLNISNTSDSIWYLIRMTSDSNNNLHVVWSHLSATPTVFYVKKTNETWSEPLAISPPAAGSYCGSMFPLIVSDSNDHLHVVMNTCLSASPTTSSLFYAKFNGSQWSEPVNLNISSSGNSGGADFGLAVDKFNYPHIIASSRISGKWGMHHIYWNGSNWTSPVDISGTGNYAELARLTVDNSGIIHGIWWEDVTGQGLHTLYSSYDGTDWSESEIIPNIPARCYPIDIVADIFSYIHVICGHIQEGVQYFYHIWK